MRVVFKYKLLVFAWVMVTFGYSQNVHWSQKIRHVSRYLGPNALPVEEMQDARADTVPWLRLGTQYHNGTGDNTYNGLATFQAPLYSRRVSIRLHMMPYEYFSLGEQTIKERRQFDTSTTGKGVGDLNIATHITLWEETGKRPAVQAIINLRTASGGNLQQARFIDAPGYTLKFAAGKSYGNKQRLRWYVNAGLRVYQTRRPDADQNDAVVYGVGHDFIGHLFTAKVRVTGYAGYFDAGDKPLVLRMRVLYNKWKKYQAGLELQQGNKDYDFTSYTVYLTRFF